MRVARGSASWLSHGKWCLLQNPGVSGDIWGSQEGCQGPFRPSGRNRGLPLSRRRGQGPHLEGKQRTPLSSRVATRISWCPLCGLTCLRKGTPLASRVAQGVSGPSSSCVWNPRVFADPAWPGEQSRVLSPNGRGGWTPLRPHRGHQDISVATREESGVLCFPSRRGLTPRGRGRLRGFLELRPGATQEAP